MSLRDQALADAQFALENASDFGQDINLIAPDGTVTPMRGYTGDITELIEPDSGQIVTGRSIHVMLFINSLPPGPRPVGIQDLNGIPWRVSFPNISSKVVKSYGVRATQPDDAMGTLSLELGDVV